MCVQASQIDNHNCLSIDRDCNFPTAARAPQTQNHNIERGIAVALLIEADTACGALVKEPVDLRRRTAFL